MRASVKDGGAGNLGAPKDRDGGYNWGETSGRASKSPNLQESIEGEVFRPRERLKTTADFDRLKREGRTFNGAHVRVRAASNANYPPATCTRMGVVVPKKQLKRAVDRNLLKRRVRHIFRTNKPLWPERVDFIVYVSASALEGGFDGVRDDLFAWSAAFKKREAQSADRAAYVKRKSSVTNVVKNNASSKSLSNGVVKNTDDASKPV
jgi:ribonuclease P protein component